MEYKRLSDANIINEQYMDSILFEEHLIGTKLASTECELFGQKWSMPVMTPAFSHLGNYSGRELTGLEEYSIGARNLNILNFCGMMENDMFKKIIDTGAKTVRFVKPYADNGKVRDQMKFAEEVGAFGIGMDIDHIFGETGYDIVIGEEMAAQTEEMLASYIESTKLPFFVKGVLSVEDAEKCAKLGAKGIIVSHHHGRLPYAIPPMMILPEIKEALVETDVKIIVDCGIASGYDVYKALALGADAACPGRSMLPSLEKDGTEGMERFFTKIRDELRFAMSSTGFEKTEDIDDSALWIKETI
ncbi:MAG: alpha-hydroxy-acid oxidizing protein [Lachnospiraceae bacterium]|nr:alpha-hydroxy-acid oxidizing protein [Lachnospiraceae bacterium]